jgi:hypothetical protein
MQACSTCGARPYKQFLDAGCYRWYQSINPCYTWPWRGVLRVDPGHLPYICGELARASALKEGECNTQPINSL